jgi:hypothetical protein
MNLRMRQICLVARELAPTVETFREVFGFDVCFRDPGVGKYGLENALFPIGNGFLEVVAPTRERTTACRYLDRRGGDGGYMVITQCADLAPRGARCEAIGVRVANENAMRATTSSRSTRAGRGRRGTRDAPPPRPLPPRPRQAHAAHRQARAGPRAPHHRDKDVPRDGDAVLARKGDGRRGGVGVI